MKDTKYLLGLDIGTSSIKAALIDADTGLRINSAISPDFEMPIHAIQSGWAEQSPNCWWDHSKTAIEKLFLSSELNKKNIIAIGIAYQMHGLVAVDSQNKALRPSIIWCDSRAASIGDQAFSEMGKADTLNTILNNPGNFTASKLAWVRINEPDIYKNIHRIMLPGDFIAACLSGEVNTTISGLSEGMFWDFKNHAISDSIITAMDLDDSMIPPLTPTFGVQSVVCKSASDETGLPIGIPISYRAGDQPNNATSLNVFEPGELAATAGTSGVIYGILDQLNHDPQSRVNIFAHVNHQKETPRLGVLLCVNGTGIQYSWIKNQLLDNTKSYAELNAIAQKAPAGSDGLKILPFGNGVERILQNRPFGGQFLNIDFNRHSLDNIIRAAKEGIVYALNYGFEAMREMGVQTNIVKAGAANMFQSPLFSQIFATVTDTRVELYDTDGAIGAARAAGVGIGHYSSLEEAFKSLKIIEVVEPEKELSDFYKEQYEDWKHMLTNSLK
ncbi:MAG: carbohydrate kinase [Bacteroidetes bacterium]|nr:carbohydrate kinase [Bacteroidota bacterium]